MILFLDCSAGIAGDMFVAALLDAGDIPLAELAAALEGLPVRDYSLDLAEVKRGGFAAKHFTVNLRQQDQPHRHYSDIVDIIDGWQAPAGAKARAAKIFEAIARAEAKAHGLPLERVHFHEVGAVDSIVDILGAAWLLDRLEVERVVATPINLGSGSVETAHGTLSVPAPATLELTRGLEVYARGPEVELTTPTGAAILAGSTTSFEPMPPSRPVACGAGAGTRELSIPNILRATLLQGAPRIGELEEDRVAVLETQIDDSTAEIIAYTQEKLLAAGALDVYATPIVMKKGRSGVLLTVLAPAGAEQELAELMMRETGTLGVRLESKRRLIRPREIVEVQTQWGSVRMKKTDRQFTPEYEDCRALAEKHGVSLREVMVSALAASLPRNG